MLGMLGGRDVLAPEVALHAEDHRHDPGAERIGSRIVGIGLFEGQERRGGDRFGRGIVLTEVEVAVIRRGHDGMMSGGGSGDAALGAAPRHDRGVGRKSPFENLVPAQQAAALGVEEGLDAADHVALQLIDVFQPLFAHPRGAFGAGAPALLRGFVAADVDILRGEESDHLGKDVFEEFERLFVADAEVGVDIGFPAARKFGEDGQHLLAVARHLDFGDHLDMQGAGVFDHLADFVLRIVAAIGRRIVAAAVAFAAEVPPLPVGIGPPCGDVGKDGVFLDLDAPAGAVGQVPVEAVEFVAGQEVQLPLDELLVAEVARDVEHEAPVAEARSVLDHNGRNPAAAAFGQLAQRLKSVEESGGIGRRDGDFSAGDVEAVAFGRAALGKQQVENGDVVPGGFGERDGEKAVAGAPHPRLKVGLGLPFEVGRKEQRSGDNTRRKVAARVPACREKHACGGEKQKSWFHR